MKKIPFIATALFLALGSSSPARADELEVACVIGGAVVGGIAAYEKRHILPATVGAAAGCLLASGAWYEMRFKGAMAAEADLNARDSNDSVQDKSDAQD